MKRHGLKDDDIGIEEDATCEIDSEHLNTAASFVPPVFERLMLDEAQNIKSNKAMAFRSPELLEVPVKTLLTATPMLTKPDDLHGVLSLLWKDEFA